MRKMVKTPFPTIVRWLAPAVLAGALACGGTPPPEAVRPADAGRGAALASVTVENRTTRRLAIAFRPAASAGAEVVVGRLGPERSMRMAPVPADEPLVLIARDETGAALTLDPRTFEVDGEWRWLIEADSRFSAADDEEGGS